MKNSISHPVIYEAVMIHIECIEVLSTCILQENIITCWITNQRIEWIDPIPISIPNDLYA